MQRSAAWELPRVNSHGRAQMEDMEHQFLGLQLGGSWIHWFAQRGSKPQVSSHQPH